MSYGFGNEDKSNIPSQAIGKNQDGEKRKVPKSNKNMLSSSEEITQAAVVLTDKGLLNQRESIDPANQSPKPKFRKMGRPKKIKNKDTMTLTGEKCTLDKFRIYCEKNPDKSFVECLDQLLR